MKSDGRLVIPAVLVASLALAALLLRDRFRHAAQHEHAAPSASEPPIERPIVAPLASSQAPAPSAPPPPPPAWVHESPESASACGEGMVLVDGIYCPYVGHHCVRFLNEEKDVCAAFAPEVICEGRLEHRRFCVDRFEYPNEEGAVPAVMIDYDEAKRACAVEDKRLCTTDEWQFACEGPEMWPYPYGIDRDATACNIDRPWTEPDLAALSDPWKTSDEIARLDKRVPSGSRPRCVSPFGARDMTGNVDEWTTNESGKVDDKPYKSALKGGYWGPIRARCRPATTTHNEWFSFYQVGFRCCRDPKGGAPSRDAPGARVPHKQRMRAP